MAAFVGPPLRLRTRSELPLSALFFVYSAEIVPSSLSLIWLAEKTRDSIDVHQIILGRIPAIACLGLRA